MLKGKNIVEICGGVENISDNFETFSLMYKEFYRIIFEGEKSLLLSDLYDHLKYKKCAFK